MSMCMCVGGNVCMCVVCVYVCMRVNVLCMCVVCVYVCMRVNVYLIVIFFNHKKKI